MSILNATGQLWKVLLGTAITVIGGIGVGIAVMAAMTLNPQVSASSSMLLLFVSASIVIGANVWIMVSVDVRTVALDGWWNSAYRGSLSAEFFGTDPMSDACPSCGHTGANAKR